MQIKGSKYKIFDTHQFHSLTKQNVFTKYYKKVLQEAL
jgi:hypothetical protein